MLTSLAAFNSALQVGKIKEASNLVHIILQVLDHSRCTVFNQVVHTVKRLEDTPPLLWLTVHGLPEMLADDDVVLPVVGVVSQHLELAVRDVPVLVRSGLLEDLLVFD